MKSFVEVIKTTTTLYFIIILCACASKIVYIDKDYHTPMTIYSVRNNDLIIKTMVDDCYMVYEVSLLDHMGKNIQNYILMNVEKDDIINIKIGKCVKCIDFIERLKGCFDDDYFQIGRFCLKK